jgi:predicted O-linked N-acetylglucosamine transferase (SPINDLY family)
MHWLDYCESRRTPFRCLCYYLLSKLKIMQSTLDGIELGDHGEGVTSRLAGLPFPQLLTAMSEEELATDKVIRAYRAWIQNNSGSEHLYAAWFNLGVEAGRIGDTAAALQSYKAALALKSDFYGAAINWSFLLEKEGRTEDALSVLANALQPDNARVALLNQRARLLEKCGKLDEAATALKNSLVIDRSQPDVIQHFVHLRQSTCSWPILATDGLPVPRDELIADCGPLSALALTDRIAGQTAITARWLNRQTSATSAHLSPANGYQHSVLRIGYISSDFGRHAMSYLVAELFERHDRARFTIYGFCIGKEDGSEIRDRIRKSFDHFVTLHDLSDEQAAHVIRGHEVDILIDLNGLTSGARPQILRWRPAPIQAGYLGYIGPTPLPELDYLFCDDYVVPPELSSLYRPLPQPVGRIFQPNDTRRTVGSPISRALNGLPEESFVFCCFAKHFKVTQELFGAWMTILGNVQNSVLWLAADNKWSQSNLRAEAEKLGVEAGRIIFADRVDPATYIVRMKLADLFLDTFPYNAGTVASDALRMELPLVTVEGESFASRMAGRLLNAIGADEGVTHSLQDYIGIAVALATDASSYERYKSKFTLSAWQETLGDMERFTEEYESVLLQLHARLIVDA